MGKRDKRKKSKAKDGALASHAKTKGKDAEKAAKKSLKKQLKDQDEPVEDIDAILRQLHQEQVEAFKVTEEQGCSPPSRRVNGSLLSNPLNANEMFLFGGEYYDGQKVHVYNDLFKYKIDKNEWTKITSPHSPGPRCSHYMVATPTGKAFLFGGEFVSPNQSSFFHYKDFWVLDLKTSSWEKLEGLKPKPSPRSGHRMVLWKQYIILFGGFYDIGSDVRYYDDVWVFDLINYKWSQVVLPETSPRPSPRSGFQFLVHNDVVVLYGGYCKKIVPGKGQKHLPTPNPANCTAKGVVHTDLWHLKLNTDINLIRWERKKNTLSQVFSPGVRSGCTMTYYKGKGVMFGGVTDTIETEEALESVCHNDMFLLNMDACKWYPLTLRSNNKKNPKKAVSRGHSVHKRGNKKHLERLKKLDALFEDKQEEEVEEDDDASSSEEEEYDQEATLEKMNENEMPSDMTTILFPWPRFSAMTCTVKNIWGGILETAEREYTLGDFWAIHLDKMVEWQPILIDNIDQAWQGQDEGSDEESDEESDDDDEDSNNEQEEKQETTLKDTLEQEDPNGTPQPDETLRDFFVRTVAHWQFKALHLGDSEQRGKNLRRNAFQMAQETWTYWQPKLQEFKKLIDDNEADVVDASLRQVSAQQDRAARNRR